MEQLVLADFTGFFIKIYLGFLLNLHLPPLQQQRCSLLTRASPLCLLFILHPSSLVCGTICALSGALHPGVLVAE